MMRSMMRVHATHLGLVAAMSILVACGDDDGGGAPAATPTATPSLTVAPTATPVPAPDLITFESFDLRPEGIEYDVFRGQFVVGSTTQGAIQNVSDDGTLSTVIADPGLASTVGTHLDRESGLLYVAGAFSETNKIGLGVYDLEAGEVVRVVDLSPVAPVDRPHLANDVVVDSAGTAYVTDTFAGAVYAVAAGTVSVLLADPALSLANGIEIVNDEVLLVARIGGTNLVRIPIDDPESFELVASDVDVSGDGIIFTPEGDLVVVTIGGPASVILLSSDDDWRTASLEGTWDSSQVVGTTPTTAAIRGNDVFVVFARVLENDVSRYDIERVEFE